MLSEPGGTHSVIKGLSRAQENLNLQVILVDRIKLFGKRYQSSSELPHGKKNEYINEFHFCLSFLHILLRNPTLVINSRLNILHFHGPWYFESKIQNPTHRIRNIFKYLTELMLIHSFPLIVCVSEEFAELLSRKYRVNRNKISVIPVGIDIDHFSPKNMHANMAVNRRTFQVGTVRRLVPRMGLELLIHSIIDLENTNLVIAGKGPLSFELEKLINALNLNDRVKLIGYVPDKDLPDFYRSLDVCVIPSVALEGFCISALEAMACGVPVIASDLDGLRSSVGKCDEELLFEPNSVESLVVKIKFAKEHLLDKPFKFRKYAEQYDWQQIATRYEDLFLNHGKRKYLS